MSCDNAVRRMYVDGQQRWPAVELEFEAFRRHCLTVFGPATFEPSRFGADLYLCCACAARNPLALLAYEREHLGVAKTAIARINQNHEFVEETLRELWDKLLFSSDAKVAAYSGRGPLQAWIRVAAARVAIDRCRARKLAWVRRLELKEQLEATGFELDATLMKARYGETFQKALEQALATLTPQDRNRLRMHVVDRCSIDQIGRAYGVHRATAARWLERARNHVLESVRRALCLQYGPLTDSEFTSIARAMGSELELSLSSYASEPFVHPSQSA
jgi:RNA polymerase sigma-70 factor, ECF subfamily